MEELHIVTAYPHVEARLTQTWREILYGPWHDWAKKNGLKLIHHDEQMSYELAYGYGHMAAKLVTGDVPWDCVLLLEAQMHPYVGSGYLDDITDIFSEEDRKDIMNARYDTCSFYKSRWYSVPYHSVIDTFYIRTDVFEEAGIEPPTKYEEVLEASEKLAKSNSAGRQIFWGLCRGDHRYSTWTFMRFLVAAGGKFVDDDGRVAFNSPEGERALDLLKRVFNSPGTLNVAEEDHMMLRFAAGDAAMVDSSGTTQMHRILEYNSHFWSRDIKGKNKPILVPGDKIRSVSGTYCNYGMYGIAKKARNKDAAKEFLKYISSVEFQKQIALEFKLLPARKSVLESPEVMNDELIGPMVNVAIEQLKYPIIPLLYSDEYFQAEKIAMDSVLVAALDGEITTKETLAVMEYRINEIRSAPPMLSMPWNEVL